MVANESEPIPDSIKWDPGRVESSYGQQDRTLTPEELTQARLDITRPSADVLEEPQPRRRPPLPPDLPG
jgi:hypothetical protein